jgi:hypothetical protein
MTWTDPRFSSDNLRKLRAEYLSRRLTRPFAIWGAGVFGRRLARALEAHDKRPEYFIDIDAKKIGRIARGKPILDVDSALARARTEGILVLPTVGAEGARDLIRAELDRRGFVEGRDYLCAA